MVAIPDVTAVPTSSVADALAWGLGIALFALALVFGLFVRSLDGQIKALRANLAESNSACDARLSALEQRYDRDVERLRRERDEERAAHKQTEALAITELAKLRDRVAS